MSTAYIRLTTAMLWGASIFCAGIVVGALDIADEADRYRMHCERIGGHVDRYSDALGLPVHECKPSRLVRFPDGTYISTRQQH